MRIENKTPKGNRMHLNIGKSKSMSKYRYGIIINYSDYHAKNKSNEYNFFDFKKISIKDLYGDYYDRLRFYGSGSNSSLKYITKKEVLINPVGELRAIRYFITKDGQRRLIELKKKKFNRFKRNKTRRVKTKIFNNN